MRAFLLRLMGITPEHWAMMHNTPAAYKTGFEGFAALSSSIAFAMVTHQFAVTFMEYPEAAAWGLGVATAITMLAMDLQCFSQLRLCVSEHRKTILAWVTLNRILVFTMLLIGSIVSAVSHQSDAIASLRAQDARRQSATLENDPRYQDRLARASDRLHAAQERVKTWNQVVSQLHELEDQLRRLRLEYQNQIDGATTSNGRTRQPGKGPIALGIEHEIAALVDQQRTLETRKASLGDPADAAQQAKHAHEELKAIRDDIERDIHIEQGGSTQRMTDFFRLFTGERWLATLLPVVFSFLILWIWDIALIIAYGLATHRDPSEDEIANGLLTSRLEHIVDQRIALRRQRSAKRPPLEVRYTNGPSPYAHPGATGAAGTAGTAAPGHRSSADPGPPPATPSAAEDAEDR